MIRGHMLFEVKAVEEPLLVACLLAHHADVSPSFLLRLGPWPTSNVQSFSTQLAKSGPLGGPCNRPRADRPGVRTTLGIRSAPRSPARRDGYRSGPRHPWQRLQKARTGGPVLPRCLRRAKADVVPLADG